MLFSINLIYFNILHHKSRRNLTIVAQRHGLLIIFVFLPMQPENNNGTGVLALRQPMAGREMIRPAAGRPLQQVAIHRHFFGLSEALPESH